MSFSFCHETYRIKPLFPTVEFTIQELVDAARLEEERDLTKHTIIEATGKQVLSPGVAVGITLMLTHDWQIEWWPGNYTATISGGNLVSENGDPIAYVVGGPQVEITLSAAATITTAGGATPTAEQIAEAVWTAANATTLLTLASEMHNMLGLKRGDPMRIYPTEHLNNSGSLQVTITTNPDGSVTLTRV